MSRPAEVEGAVGLRGARVREEVTILANHIGRRCLRWWDGVDGCRICLFLYYFTQYFINHVFCSYWHLTFVTRGMLFFNAFDTSSGRDSSVWLVETVMKSQLWVHVTPRLKIPQWGMMENARMLPADHGRSWTTQDFPRDPQRPRTNPFRVQPSSPACFCSCSLTV